MEMTITIVAALLLDAGIGEPRRWHPLVGFGGLANCLEQRLRSPYVPDSVPDSLAELRRGGMAWAILVLLLPLSLFAALPFSPVTIVLITEIFVLYFCVGHRAMREHAAAVQDALDTNNEDRARVELSRIVGRDCDGLDSNGISRGVVESVLENGNDAVIAPLFWFICLGAPGALLYRLANTLDAMWGYRSDRYRYFGYMSACMDDLLNWIPARCCALLYALVGKTTTALRCWREQAASWDSPNAGAVMASGSGALQVLIGSAACYQGVVRQRPTLGKGEITQAADIGRSVSLVTRALYLFVAIVVISDVIGDGVL